MLKINTLNKQQIILVGKTRYVFVNVGYSNEKKILHYGSIFINQSHLYFTFLLLHGIFSQNAVGHYAAVQVN